MEPHRGTDGVFRELVKRKAVEQAQQDKARRVKAVLDAMPVQVWPFMLTVEDRAFLRVQRIRVD